MHMALGHDEWLRLNTSYCNRLCAWISGKACDANMGHSTARKGDFRCAGCNGLHDQPEATGLNLAEALSVAIAEAVQGMGEDGAETILEHVGYDLGELNSPILGVEAVEEVLAELFQLDLEEEGLAVEVAYQREVNRQKRRQLTPRKVAVYKGRCNRCGSYMVNSPERQFDTRDEEVYRCYSCGWRTSPAYSWNRENPPANYMG